MPDSNYKPADDKPSFSFDIERLETFAREAETLVSRGHNNPVEAVLGQLDEQEREKYREPLHARLVEIFQTLESEEQANAPSTSEAASAKTGTSSDTCGTIGSSPADLNSSVSEDFAASMQLDTSQSIDLDTDQTMDRPFGLESETIALPPSRHKSNRRSKSGESADAKPPNFIGKFRIKEELGRGAFGVVYLGYDQELKRNVAIKVSLVSDRRLQERLRVEASKVAQVESPGIVPVYHIGKTDNGKVYFVQKYIEGPTLRDLIRQGPFSPLRTARLIQEIALGLEPAHSQDIIHRDLKPDNILLDKSGRCWIADFGLAISEDEQQGRRHELAGTPPYMSPEQIMRRVHFLDPRSDIWALGVMYYEMLSGKLPFIGKDVNALKEQICEQDPRPLHQREPSHLTEEMHAIFTRCCAKEPADRFASVHELASALEELIASGLRDQNVLGEEMTARFGDDATSLANSHRLLGGRIVAASTGLDSSVAPTKRSTGETLTDSARDIPLTSRRNLSIGALAVFVMLAGFIGFQTYQSRFSNATKQQFATQPESLKPGPAANPPEAMAERSEVDASAVLEMASPRSESTGSTAEPLHHDNMKDSGDPMVEATNAIENADVGGPPSNMQTNAPLVLDHPEEEVPAKPKGMGFDEANGSEAKPWVVASDGTGSHKTISEALAAGPSEAFIRITPGIYREHLIISQPVNLYFDEREDGDGQQDDSTELRCNLRSGKASPIEVDCPNGRVLIRGLSIEGEGHKTTQEFNAINVTRGTLILEDCEVRTTSYNCVKVHEAASLGVRGCRFLDSSAFAISTKNHDTVQVIDSIFLRSGIQLVGGRGSIEDCEFFGIYGCYVSRSNRLVTITDSKFESCQDYAVAVADQGKVKMSNCEIADCELGINLQDGELEVSGDTKIRGGRTGIGATTGTLILKDVEISDLDAGIVVTDQADVDIERLVITRCQTTGIALKAGRLRMHESRIEDCFIGFEMGDEKAWPKSSATVDLTDVKIRRCGNYGLAVFSGPVTMNNIEVNGCLYGLYVQGPPKPQLDRTTSVVEANVSDAKLLQNKQVPLVARGDCSVTFVGEPMPQGSRALDGAFVSELPSEVVDTQDPRDPAGATKKTDQERMPK